MEPLHGVVVHVPQLRSIVLPRLPLDDRTIWQLFPVDASLDDALENDPFLNIDYLVDFWPCCLRTKYVNNSWVDNKHELLIRVFLQDTPQYTYLYPVEFEDHQDDFVDQNFIDYSRDNAIDAFINTYRNSCWQPFANMTSSKFGHKDVLGYEYILKISRFNPSANPLPIEEFARNNPQLPSYGNLEDPDSTKNRLIVENAWYRFKMKYHYKRAAVVYMAMRMYNLNVKHLKDFSQTWTENDLVTLCQQIDQECNTQIPTDTDEEVDCSKFQVKKTCKQK